MPNDDPAQSDGRIVKLSDAAERRRAALSQAGHAQVPPGLQKYSQDDDEDDYRHRMVTNVAALGLLVLLIVAGIWIADTMASIRKNQDCVLSGRRGCTPVDAPPAQRW